MNIADLLPPPLLRQDVASWRQKASRVAGMHQAQEGVVIGVGVRAVRIWPLSSTTSASTDLVVFDHGDTVVAILNEVRLVDLVEAHCRRLLSPVVRAIYAAAPLGPNHLVPRADP